ncbi:MAG: hypothetical protein ABIJ65_07695, partial [Chloroflexota bacterium]
MFKRIVFSILIISALLFSTVPARAAKGNNTIGVNVLLKSNITNKILKDLGSLGKVRDVVYEINALTIQIKASNLATLRARPYVASA